jgi:hypothetical protein
MGSVEAATWTAPVYPNSPNFETFLLPEMFPPFFPFCFWYQKRVEE